MVVAINTACSCVSLLLKLLVGSPRSVHPFTGTIMPRGRRKHSRASRSGQRAAAKRGNFFFAKHSGLTLPLHHRSRHHIVCTDWDRDQRILRKGNRMHARNFKKCGSCGALPADVGSTRPGKVAFQKWMIIGTQ